MGGSIVGIHTDETKADQYASNCNFVVPLVGGANDASASIACTMSTKTVTVMCMLQTHLNVIFMVKVLYLMVATIN